MIKEIMLVKLRALGDVITIFPLVRALKERFPEAGLTVVADETYQDLFEHHTRVDSFWSHPVKTLKSGGTLTQIRHHRQMVRAIKQKKVDLYIDLYGSIRTALWGAMAGVPRRMGFNLRGRKHFYHDRIIARHRYVVDLNLQFARELGWTGTDNSLEFFIAKADKDEAFKTLAGYGFDAACPYVVISPGGGWPIKCWDAKKFGQFANQLAKETGCQIVLSGTVSEKNLLQICAAEVERPVYQIINLPLRQVAAVISQSRLFIGNDSGPKYFAESFKVPTLICYGPTDFVNNNPVSPIHLTAYREVVCRPCHSETCSQVSRICLDDLTVDEVLKKAFALWKLNRN